MEYLIFAAALLLVGAFFLLSGVWNERRTRKWQAQKFREKFGKPSDREYEAGETDSIPSFFLRHRNGFFIDDITWNDLDLDMIFLRMNTAVSSAGQEYLYHMLRTPVFEEGELQRREAQIRYFTDHPEERVRLQMLYRRLGRTGKYSIYDYLDFLDTLGERSSLRSVILDILILAGVFLTAVSPRTGLLALIALICLQISTYMKEKRDIEPYLISFKYVLRAVGMAEALRKEKVPAVAEEQKQLAELLPRFKALKRGASLGMHSLGSDGSPLGIVLDYLNLIFHFDIIGFNFMLHQVRRLVPQIDALLTVLGRIDAMIAAAGFRKGLSVWCEPVFNGAGAQPGTDAEAQPGAQTGTDAEMRPKTRLGTDAEVPPEVQTGALLEIRGLYHPLLEEPVKNDILARRGVLLTGSNASGKSTFLKAAALNAVLAQTIHTCCASFYRADFFRTMTSMALRDDLVGGESYYIVEIKSLKRILDAAETAGGAQETNGGVQESTLQVSRAAETRAAQTKDAADAKPAPQNGGVRDGMHAPVLCFVDEVLRGTNTVERIAASVQILKSLCRPGVCCFAATHDIELTELLKTQYDNYHFEEEIADGDIRFPYRLMPGRASTRNAIRLLSIMGYEEDIIARAEQMAARFGETGIWE